MSAKTKEEKTAGRELQGAGVWGIHDCLLGITSMECIKSVIFIWTKALKTKERTKVVVEAYLLTNWFIWNHKAFRWNVLWSFQTRVLNWQDIILHIISEEMSKRIVARIYFEINEFILKLDIKGLFWNALLCSGSFWRWHTNGAKRSAGEFWEGMWRHS